MDRELILDLTIFVRTFGHINIPTYLPTHTHGVVSLPAGEKASMLY